jgi:hypothetical protein
MPGKGILTAGDKTGTAFQTTLVIHDHLTLLIELVEIGRANVQTISDHAAALADILVDKYMGLFTVNLEYVQPQFSLDIQLKSSLAVSFPYEQEAKIKFFSYATGHSGRLA